MKITIFGASGSGTTTLARSLSQRLGWVHLDADDYYWAKTDIPFQNKQPKEVRNENLKRDFEVTENVIVSGSLVTWSEYWNSAFDLGVLLRLPHKIRMERLRNREKKRYSEKLKSDIEIKNKYEAFIAWAAKYDDTSFNGRSITQHKNWIKLLTCETIEIEGDLTTDARINIVIEKIKNTYNI
ncbi:AAA family ATPase [Fulvivirga sp. M361]|uniref:AAA family ATPase n=1 Tax=Fulvivirga sp. M361 TaxID=2594266 RepID=UPI00117A0A8C|nr:AAA family ATPase [Fulvivirga sp. M361]TRX61408.1 AAA family ATPase [Fulvivirga sp. M361]